MRKNIVATHGHASTEIIVGVGMMESGVGMMESGNAQKYRSDAWSCVDGNHRGAT
jgi:hypothetical protein